MKKLLALVLSLVMALSLIPTVWGTELDDVFAQLWEAGYRAPTTEPRMEFPSGLVRGVDYDCIYQYEENYKDYVLTIVVKEGTSADWETAYQTAYQNDGVDSGNLDMVIFMPEPDSDVVRTSRSLNGNISGSRVNSFISGTGLDYTDQVLTKPGTGVSIAALNRSEDSVTITPVEEGDMYFLMLYDKDNVENNGNETKWLIHYRVVKEKDFAYRVALPKVYPVDSSRIDISKVDTSQWRISVEDGVVTAQALNPSITTWQYVGHWIVKAPDGYTDGNGNDGVGNDFYGPGVSTANFTWYDQNGQPLQERLTFIVRKAAPYFKDDCTPADYLLVPALPSGGVRVDYDRDTGMYHTVFDRYIVPTVTELSSIMGIPVPDGAKSYRYLPQTTNQDPFIVVSDPTYLNALKQGNLHVVDDPEGYVLPIANLDKVVLRDERMTVYFMYSQYYTVRVIQWYSDEAGTETMGAPVYVFGYNDGFVWSTTTESVSQVTGAVTAPVLEGQTGLTLTGVRYPQESSGNTLYIELSASGEVGDSNVVYLPYSYFDGLSYELAVERNLPDPVIHHYNEARSEYTDIRGEYTEYGIKFTTPSFSPFTVTCAPLRGDVNGDGKEPDITDVACLYEQLLTGGGDTKWEGKMLDAALDVNGDGQADVYDLQRLYEYVSGIDSKW